MARAGHGSLAVVKGIRESHEVKKPNSYDLGGNQTHDLRLRTRNGRSNPEVVGSIPTKVT